MDRALVEAARSGDEEAFASIARGSADRLFGIAHRILRDTGRAEDAVQQTLVKAWKELPGLRESDRFDAWIHRILVHACYAEAKRASAWSANVVALTIEGPSTPDSTLGVATRDALERGFRRLPPEQRAVLRPPPLPRLAARRDRRDARGAARHGQVEAPLRHSDPPGGPRGRRPDGEPSLSGANGMTDNEFDRTARAWLEDGPTLISDRALQSALDEVHRNPTAPGLVAGAEATNVHSNPSRRGGRSDRAHRRRRQSPLRRRGGGPFGPTPTPSPTPIVLREGEPAPLEPGTYVTADPFRVRVTFTVPAEWQGNMGGPNAVFLSAPSTGDEVIFSLFEKVYADPCHFEQGFLDPLPGPSTTTWRPRSRTCRDYRPRRRPTSPWPATRESNSP